MNYKHILLIDDDEDDREIFQEAIATFSEEIICDMESDAGVALKKLESGELLPELIFVDLHMTIFSGQEFLQHIKTVEKLKHLPVIVLSTHSGDAMRVLTKGLGAEQYITKPDSFSALVNILKSIL